MKEYRLFAWQFFTRRCPLKYSPHKYTFWNENGLHADLTLNKLLKRKTGSYLKHYNSWIYNSTTKKNNHSGCVFGWCALPNFFQLTVGFRLLPSTSESISKNISSGFWNLLWNTISHLNFTSNQVFLDIFFSIAAYEKCQWLSSRSRGYIFDFIGVEASTLLFAYVGRQFNEFSEGVERQSLIFLPKMNTLCSGLFVGIW